MLHSLAHKLSAQNARAAHPIAAPGTHKNNCCLVTMPGACAAMARNPKTSRMHSLMVVFKLSYNQGK
jgi:hypothetical protein